MRQSVGDEVLLFNGSDGEWRCEITQLQKRAATLTGREMTRAQTEPPDLWLLFAPIKKARTDFIAEKATEMGAARIQAVFTRHTNSERVNEERLRAHAIEAAEQCGLLSTPAVAQSAKLSSLLHGWDDARRLMFCDETLPSGDARPALASAGPGAWAILIGPEGGFSPEEIEMLRALPFTTPVSLGPRILRADTAAVAAMALWQSELGDWR